MPSELGNPLERQVEVVVQHHHRAMIDGEPSEAALELIAVDDGGEPIRRARLVRRQQVEVGCPATFLPALGIAGAHEEPVRPGLEARRVAELREVPPDAQQRLLRRILGEVEVAQDPARHGKEPIRDLGGKEGVRLLVTSLSSDHEIGIHASSALSHRFRPMLHTVWAGWADANFNLCGGHGDAGGPIGHAGVVSCRRQSYGSIWMEATIAWSSAWRSGDVSA